MGCPLTPAWGQFPKHAARSIVERQSVRLSYTDCPTTPKVVTGTLSYSVASVVIYLRHCPFVRSVRNNEASSDPGTPRFCYEMTPFSPHRTTCPDLRFSVLPAHLADPRPPWKPYNGGHARPSQDWQRQVSARPWDRAAPSTSRPNAGGCPSRTQDGKCRQWTGVDLNRR